MNTQAAFQQFAHNVASAPEDHWLQALCAEGHALIREVRQGRLPQEQVESEIARVANEFDVAGKVGKAEADAIWELLRQAKGELAVPVAAEAIRTNPQKSDRAIADEIGVSSPTVGKARREATVNNFTVDDEPRTGLDGEAFETGIDEDSSIDESPPETERAEISSHAALSLPSWDRTMAAAEPSRRANVFTEAIKEALPLARTPEERQQIIDDLYAMGRRHGLSDTVMQVLMEAIIQPAPPVPEQSPVEPPPPGSLDDYGVQGIREAQAPKPISATPFVVQDPATLPVRDMLYGRHLIRGFVSGVIGIPGGGKTTHGMAETFARVSGKPLLGVRVRKPLRCWNINLEDPRDEIDRRAQATCLHYGLTAADIGDRLYLDSGRDQPVVVARTLAGGTQIVEPAVENIIAEIRARQIDVLTIDPFVSSHEVPENDNGAIDLVLKRAWGQVAERGRCAVELVHHLRKIGDDDPTVDAARGASAFAGALRAIRVLAVMTKAEAERAGVENPYRYFRVFSGKLSMAPREDKSDWHFLESVDLGNGTNDRPSDHVQVAVTWQWPNATDGLAVRDLFAVQKRISEGQWRESAQSPQWAGNAVAEVLDLDIEDAPPQARVKSLLKTWIASGALKVVARLDEQRKERKFVEVGQWATE